MLISAHNDASLSELIGVDSLAPYNACERRAYAGRGLRVMGTANDTPLDAWECRKCAAQKSWLRVLGTANRSSSQRLVVSRTARLKKSVGSLDDFYSCVPHLGPVLFTHLQNPHHGDDESDRELPKLGRQRR